MVINKHIQKFTARAFGTRMIFFNPLHTKFAIYHKILQFETYKRMHIMIIEIYNHTYMIIIDKVYTHSVNGFRQYVKKCMIQKYSDTCHIINCYICNQN